MLDNRIKTLCLLLPLSCLSIRPSHAQGTVPTFTRTIAGNNYTLAGRDPADKGETTIPTVLVPVTLTFGGVKPAQMNAMTDVPRILKSPVFTRYAFSPGNKTQYADGLLHATFPADTGGHTYLGKPEIKPLTIAIPPGYGYVLRSKKSGTSFAVVDVMFLEKHIFQQIPRLHGKLVIAVTHNTTYYTDNDATVCCSWGMHGVDGDSGNSFVLGSYLGATPAIVKDQDMQPLTQQLAEFINDPLHEPDAYFRTPNAVGNFFAAWLRPGVEDGCGGSGVGSNYFLLEPTNTNPTNSFPVSMPFAARAGGFTYHLANVATLHWYLGASVQPSSAFSFPDSHALTEPAQPCPDRRLRAETNTEPTVVPTPSTG
ncbi:MAG: glycoside hydrolase, partial [Acidobacteriota bacterium]